MPLRLRIGRTRVGPARRAQIRRTRGRHARQTGRRHPRGTGVVQGAAGCAAAARPSAARRGRDQSFTGSASNDHRRRPCGVLLPVAAINRAAFTLAFIGAAGWSGPAEQPGGGSAVAAALLVLALCEAALATGWVTAALEVWWRDDAGLELLGRRPPCARAWPAAATRNLFYALALASSRSALAWLALCACAMSALNFLLSDPSLVWMTSRVYFGRRHAEPARLWRSARARAGNGRVGRMAGVRFGSGGVGAADRRAKSAVGSRSSTGAVDVRPGTPVWRRSRCCSCAR